MRSAEEGIERWRRERRRAEVFGGKEGGETEREQMRNLEEEEAMDRDANVGEVGV